MPSPSLYNSPKSRHHGSAAMERMRFYWNRLFFIVIRIIMFLNQLTLMAPLLYHRNKKTVAQTKPEWQFRTHGLYTAIAISFCVALTIATPFLAQIIPGLYGATRQDQDNLFKTIAQFTMVTDVVCMLLIMSAQIWYREKLVKILNSFSEIIERVQCFEKNFVSFKIFLAFIVKVSLTVYDVALSLPFLVTASSRLSVENILAFVSMLYLQQLSSIFALTIFTLISMLLSFSLQLERQLSLFENFSNNMKMLQLIALQDALQRLLSVFVSALQFGIFMIILSRFVTILCNIYALLDYYGTNGVLFTTFITYILSVALELYSIILMAYLCDRSQRKVRDLFLNREEKYFLKMPKIFEFIDKSVLWPQLQEFTILGLFPMNNAFALFLLSYSVNFIVIILQFQDNKAI